MNGLQKTENIEHVHPSSMAEPMVFPPPRCAAPSDLVLLPVGGSQVLPAAPAAEGVSNRLERPRKRWSIQVVLDGFGWSIQVEFLLP